MARRAAAGRVAAIAIAVVAAWLAGARPAAAAESARYALLIQGASGGEPYETMHREWLDALASVLRDRFKYDAAHLFVFADEPKAGEERSTAANVRTVLGRIATTMGASDQLVVVFIGHGGGEGPDAKFNLVGPDLGVAEWKALLAQVPGRLAVVDTTSASFPYLAGLAAPGRVVITATSSYSQRFDTDFPDGFVKAFSDDEADLDKDGRISLLEAFTYASKQVAAYYQQKDTMATEHALLDDNGDGVGRQADAKGPDGSIAALTYLDTPVVPTSSDPETQRLLVRQRELTAQIDDLRRGESSMPADEYQRQFEALMTELATVSRQVRQRTGGG